MKILKPNRETLEREYFDLSQDKLSAKYGVSRITIRRWLKSFNIKQERTPCEGRNRPIDRAAEEDKLKPNRETLEREYFDLSQDRLSTKYGVSRTAIRRWLKSFNIKEEKTSIEGKAKRVAASTKNWQNKEYREKIVNTQIKNWQRQDFRLMMQSSFETPEFRIKVANSSKRVWSNPDYRARMATARENTSTTLTKPHVKVCELLTSLGVKYVTEKAIGPWNFDIFVESDNLLIEVQGDYWHSLSRMERNDKAKSTYITNNLPQYQLKYIWEHECLTEGSVLAKLKYWLGLDKVEQINYELKQVSVKPVLDTKQADAFLYNWHYQHHGRHGLDLGGYLGDELICLARWASPSRTEIATSLNYSQKQVVELARLVVHPKYQKKNLLSWFLARCEQRIMQVYPEIECLVSFADSTHNHTGAVYKASNWELNRVVEPNYWYVDSDGWVMHKKTLWNHAKKMKMSESKYAIQNGFIKVWGKEKFKFIKRLKFGAVGRQISTKPPLGA